MMKLKRAASIISQSTLCLLCVFFFFFGSAHIVGFVHSFAVVTTSSSPSQHQQQQHSSSSQQEQLDAGDNNWETAKLALRNPECCVVTVSGLDTPLTVLQRVLADQGPAELDLRVRVHTAQSSSAASSAHQDCLAILRDSAVVGSVFLDDDDADNTAITAASSALEELARGMASLADNNGQRLLLLENNDGGVCRQNNNDVFLRIVCASNYRARDPPFHTDKAPIRGYVTLRGLGTEFMTRTCNPLEYVTLRTMGIKDGSGTGRSNTPAQDVRQANELEFIVMKGDYYQAPNNNKDGSSSSSSSLLANLWQRADACVHRSPPSSSTGKGCGRRVIVSFDLADGDDDREWLEAGKRREWRNGMTQRKSRLVA